MYKKILFRLLTVAIVSLPLVNYSKEVIKTGENEIEKAQEVVNLYNEHNLYYDKLWQQIFSEEVN